MGPSGFIAVIAGWITTEVGRQPYTIYGLLRTADSVSPLAAPAVATSLIAFVIVYFAVFGMGTWYLLQAHVTRAAAARARSAARAGACRGHHAGARVRRALSKEPVMADSTVLTNVWAAILAFAVFMYVVMDGFDLGIGILFPVFGVGRERDTAMNSIAPVWDGNETWLVLGGGGLLAAFPLAYSIVLSALYAPLIAMLLALVFRGVAFEFRWRDPAHRADLGLRIHGGLVRGAPSRRASRSARCCRASTSKAAPTAAAGGTGSRRSACSRARASSRVIRCSARAGSTGKRTAKHRNMRAGSCASSRR